MTGSGLTILDAYIVVGGFSFLLGMAFWAGVGSVVRALHRRRP